MIPTYQCPYQISLEQVERIKNRNSFFRKIQLYLLNKVYQTILIINNLVASYFLFAQNGLIQDVVVLRILKS
jgi:hypothetical protein